MTSTLPKKSRPQPKGGSRKGIPNKVTAELKTMILEALGKAGGVDYLVVCAQNQRTASAFLALVGKVLPLQVTGDGDNPLALSVTVSYVDAKPRD